MNNKNHIPDLYLEQYVLGELSGVKFAEINQLLEKNEQLRKRIIAIKLSNEVIQSNYREPEFLDKKEMKKQRKKTNTWFSPWQIAPAGMLAILIVFMITPYQVPLYKNQPFNEFAENESGIRLKGIQPQLHIYRKKDQLVEEINDGAEVKENDELQIRFHPAEYNHGLIFSIDGRGEVTLHFPNHVSDSTLIESGGDIALQHAYKLDDAPKFEKFVLLTSNQEMDVREIMTYTKSIAKGNKNTEIKKLNLSSEIFQTSLTVSKAEK